MTCTKYMYQCINGLLNSGIMLRLDFLNHTNVLCLHEMVDDHVNQGMLHDEGLRKKKSSE